MPRYTPLMTAVAFVALALFALSCRLGDQINDPKKGTTANQGPFPKSPLVTPPTPVEVPEVPPAAPSPPPRAPKRTATRRRGGRILPQFLKAPQRPWPSTPTVRLGTKEEHNDPDSPLKQYKDILQSNHNHRKLWEFVSIMDAVERLGGVKPGCRGAGFGAGEEPLATYFVSRGCDVLVSDAPVTNTNSAGWAGTGQHANVIEKTYVPSVRNGPSLQDYVKKASFMPVDMNNIPEALLQGEYDFTWSAGSFEHVGGMHKSVAFFKNALRALKPGGVAAHTTEFTISTEGAINPEFGHMTAFTETVLRKMLKDVEALGYEVPPIELVVGTDGNEQVDWGKPSYRNDDHWILAAKTLTGATEIHCSVIIIAKRPGGPGTVKLPPPPVPVHPAAPQISILPKFLKDPTLPWPSKPIIRLGTRLETNSPGSPLEKYNAEMQTNATHRKLWEFSAIMDAIDRMGGINDGCRGLGFGAGKEPLATYFVKRGCSVLVTDAPQGGEWGKTEQHAGQIEQTYSTMVKDAPPLEHYVKNAAFMAVDMNNIPATLLKGEYDFTWSGGSFEHVGGMHKSVAFFKNQLKALKPGGVAAHTTEFTISHDGPVNPEYGHMTAFTETVLRKMLKDVEAMGYEVPTIELVVGADAESLVDHGIPNYRANDHFVLGGHSATSGYTVFCSVLVLAQKPRS